MITSLKQHYTEVHITTPVNILKKQITAFSYKNPIYSLIIMMASTSDQILKAAEKLELMKYYDEGHQVVFLGSVNPNHNWNVLISQFGFDTTSAELEGTGQTRL
jgi:hypothetical protein